MPLFGLADCNNFFVSCERVFRPDLNGKPVLVLSSNDGCVISRSNEAKALGIKMGVPLFQIRKEVEKYGIALFSSNYVLYGDMSRRVMSLLSCYTPKLDQYSIDESFLDFSDMGDIEYLRRYGQEIVKTVAKGTGIPISLGIAPTRTLAKVASKFAKKYKGYHGCCIIDNDEKRQKALELFEVGDVFGIGRKMKEKLTKFGIRTAADFTRLDGEWVKSAFSITGYRTWRELQGEACISLDELPAKKSICVSRSFAGEGISDKHKLEEAVANFASECARKLREQKSVCRQMTVFAFTSRFRTDLPQDFINNNINLEIGTNDSSEIIKSSIDGLRACYRTGDFAYKKAGVILWDIVSANAVQGNLFDKRDRSKISTLQNVIDDINRRDGKGTVRNAVQGDNHLSIKREHLSPLYTTDINEILVVKG
ncbi:MAG: Y-family DNA polymerase [Bacteroidales bacterium]|nr:Y-family DNA polymerase [Bacteroidales bacterium]